MTRKEVNSLEIKVPYLREVQISASRRAKKFRQGEKIPAKYSGPEFAFKDGHLFNTSTKEFVIKNPKSAGKPRMQPIAGNEMFARVHERIRHKVVEELEKHYLKYIPRDVKLALPVKCKLTLYTPFGMANWDLDNLWIYHKCFLDAAVTAGIIPEDNVLYVREAGQTDFRATTPNEPSTMVFLFTGASDVMNTFQAITLIEDPSVSPGEISVTKDHIRFGTGRRRIIFGKAKQGIRRAMFHCLNYKFSPMISTATYEKYEKFFECFKEYKLPLLKV